MKLIGFAVVFYLLILSVMPAFCEPCIILLGEGGETETFKVNFKGLSNITSSMHNIGAWSFIRNTSGRCTYQLFNDTDFRGRSNTYGITQGRIRIGAKGGNDSGGWRARSLMIKSQINNECMIHIRDNGITQIFYGPSNVDNISGYNFVTYTAGNCYFKVYNNINFQGRSISYKQGINDGQFRNKQRPGWRIRSLRITRKP